MATRFLFVNKDADSTTLSKSEGETNHAIFRHVQEHVRAPKVSSNGTSAYDEVAPPIVVRDGTLSHSARHKGLYMGSDKRNHYNQTWKNSQRRGLKLYPSIGVTDKIVDPFNATSLPITQEVHRLLTYFESLFYVRTLIQPLSSSQVQSAGHQVIQDCISDRLQMRCVLAAVAVRQETFDHCSIEGGSARYVHQAVLALQRALRKSPVPDQKLIYAIMKLYEAEAYRSNLEGALVHLHGAQAAYQQSNLWVGLDQSYTATMCGSVEAFLLGRVNSKPTIFPSLLDPGSAMVCFPLELTQQYVLSDQRYDGTGQILLASFENHYYRSPNAITSMKVIISDLIEFSLVRRNMLLQEYAGLLVPIIVSHWTHLRRIALVFRLMSVEIVDDGFFHAIRIAQIVWLSIVANYTGFDRNLQIVATHLQDVMTQLTPYEEFGAPETIVWILMLGASCGELQHSRPWFISQLSNFSRIVDPNAERSMEQWYSCLEGSSLSCLYSELLQRQSHVEIAHNILLSRIV